VIKVIEETFLKSYPVYLKTAEKILNILTSNQGNSFSISELYVSAYSNLIFSLEGYLNFICFILGIEKFKAFEKLADIKDILGKVEFDDIQRHLGTINPTDRSSFYDIRKSVLSSIKPLSLELNNSKESNQTTKKRNDLFHGNIIFPVILETVETVEEADAAVSDFRRNFDETFLHIYKLNIEELTELYNQITLFMKISHKFFTDYIRFNEINRFSKNKGNKRSRAHMYNIFVGSDYREECVLVIRGQNFSK
jgi:hypothetical protein